MPVVIGAPRTESRCEDVQVSILQTGSAYLYIPEGYRKLPLEIYDMQPEGEEERPTNIDSDLERNDSRNNDCNLNCSTCGDGIGEIPALGILLFCRVAADASTSVELG